MKKGLVIFCCLAFIGLAFADVDSFAEGAGRGMILFGRNVLPVLFPFFFMTSVLTELGFFSGFRRLGRATPVFVLSLLGGYPTGARMLSELYLRGEVTRTQAIRISTFTSTCSPIFVIATVGACFFGSISVGVIIFACHSLAAMVNGLLYRKVSFKEKTHCPPAPSEGTLLMHKPADNSGIFRGAAAGNDISKAVSDSLYSAIQNTLGIGGLIIVFFIAINQIHALTELPPAFDLLFSALFELTNGIYAASVIVPDITAAPLGIIVPCAIVSFGGLAIAMQGFLFLQTFRMPFWFYLLYKVTHTVIAVLLCLGFVLFMTGYSGGV